jgi:DNA-binding NarL/FixJ family response regulator
MTSPTARVLIVDDSHLIGKRLQEFLNQCQAVELIGQTYNIDEGRKKVATEHPEIVILDIGIPGGSGMFLIPEIKKINSNIVVIMFTNYAHSIYRKKCKDLGADYFFDKSTESELLMDLLENYKGHKLSA